MFGLWGNRPPKPEATAPEDPALIDHLRAVQATVLRAADPRRATMSALRTHAVNLDAPVVAIGKAARAMLAACDEARGRPCRALAIAPPGPEPDDDPRVMIADHPLPTARSVEAARSLAAFVHDAAQRPEARLTLLLSGGASALVATPIAPVTLDDLRLITRVLMAGGASISELNIVRRHLDALKGGRLASPYPDLAVTGLVLSDVITGDLHDVASGPCSPDPTTQAQALDLLERFDVEDHDEGALARAHRVLRDPAHESLKPGDPRLARATMHIIGDHHLARKAAIRELRRLDFSLVLEVPQPLTGEARDAARKLVLAITEEAATNSAPFAIVATGETTVTLGDHSGFGGRNQELALAAALDLHHAHLPRPVAVMALGTDGVDGLQPPDDAPAAGAIVTGRTVARAKAVGLLPSRALIDHDAYTFFAALDRAGGASPSSAAQIRTGPTGTNVNDILVAVIGAGTG